LNYNYKGLSGGDLSQGFKFYGSCDQGWTTIPQKSYLENREGRPLQTKNLGRV
jgi:hypothetical protein